MPYDTTTVTYSTRPYTNGSLSGTCQGSGTVSSTGGTRPAKSDGGQPPPHELIDVTIGAEKS